MTARKSTILTLANAVGNGTPATADIIAVQNAVLASNAGLLGAVTQFQKDIGQRLDRQFGETAESLVVVEGKVDGLDTRLRGIEEERRTAARLAEQAKGFAAENATKAKDTATEAKDTAATNNADRAAHALSYNQRLAIGVAAVSGVGALALGVLNFLAGR